MTRSVASSLVAARNSKLPGETGDALGCCQSKETGLAAVRRGPLVPSRWPPRRRTGARRTSPSVPNQNTAAQRERPGQGADWYRREVLPRLSADAVFPADAIRYRSGGRLRGRCPLHGDEDRASRRFSVHPETLGWRCFSCNKSGDALAFLAGGQSPRGDAYHDAVRQAAHLAGVPETEWPRWLAQDGPRARFKMPRSAPQPKPALEYTQAVRARSSVPERDSPRAKQVARLWNMSGPADGTPADAYLAGRFAWPSHVWPLPADVRWIAAKDVLAVLPRWALPMDAAGCLAFAYRDLASNTVRAIKLEALTADGKTCRERWRRNVGKLQGLRFLACDLPGGRLHVAEGEVSALALAVRCRAREYGAATALGGASGMASGAAACRDSREGRAVAIHADRDRAGRIAARALRRALVADGLECVALGTSEGGSDGADAADALRAEVEERAGIREFSEGTSAGNAELLAWEEVLEWLMAGGEL